MTRAAARAPAPALLAVLLLVLVLAAPATFAAPVILDVGFNSPVRHQVNDPLLIMAWPVDASATVMFWNGTASNLPGTVLGVDPDRGFVAVRVPPGAQSGPMILSVGGVAAAPFHVGIFPGTFDGGSVPVGGRVLGPGGAPVAGALVALLKPTCDDVRLWDADVTDATGAYSVTAAPGTYQVMALSPRATQFYTTGGMVTVESQALALDLETGQGAPTAGRVVDGTDGTTPVAGALVSFDGEGHDQAVTGADGRFTLYLAPGTWESEVVPPRGSRFRPRDDDGIVIPPGPSDLGSLPLDRSGVQVTGVLRGPSGEVLAGAEISAVTDNPCCQSYWGLDSFGDGSFAITLPPNATYRLRALFGEEAVFVDAMAAITVGATDMVQDLATVRAAFIDGTVRDRASGEGIEGASAWAHRTTDTATVADMDTCPDGRFRLRVPPAADLLVGAAHWEQPYVPIAWNGGADGTPFRCEGAIVRLASAGASTTIDLDLRAAASISGTFRSQASGCSAPTGGGFVRVDDGAEHACSLGFQNMPSPSPQTYTLTHLPPLTMVPGLRACVSAPDAAPQCWSLERPPAYDPLHLGEGEARTGVDFCLGTQPTAELRNLRAERFGGTVHFTWDPSTDLYHSTYVFKGAQAAWMSFQTLTVTEQPSADQPNSAPYTFFLVRDRGATGDEGP